MKVALLLLLLSSTASCVLDVDLYGRDEPELHGGPVAFDGGVDAAVAIPPPILRYRFDGTLDNTGTLAGFTGTGASYSFVPGMHGQAIAFDATVSTGVVLPTYEALSRGGPFTITLWFREDAVSNSGGTQYLFDSRGAGGFQTYHGYGGNEALTTCSDAGCAAFGYEVGGWHQLAYRFAGQTSRSAPLELYVDGKLATTLPASTVYFNEFQKNFAVGTRTNFQIDELVVYAAALSPADLARKPL